MTNTYRNGPQKSNSLRVLLLAAALFGAVSVPSLGQAQDAWIEIDTAPPVYEEAPHAYYRGDHAYYSDGRWYARHGRRWGYYREEPRELVRYREYHHHHAAPPPPPRRHHHHHRDVIEVRPGW